MARILHMVYLQDQSCHISSWIILFDSCDMLYVMVPPSWQPTAEVGADGPAVDAENKVSARTSFTSPRYSLEQHYPSLDTYIISLL